MSTAKLDLPPPMPWKLWQKLLTILALAALLAMPAWADEDDEDEDKNKHNASLRIKEAKFKQEKHRLEVKIKVKGLGRYQALLYDAASHQLLKRRASDDDSLKLKVGGLQGSEVPCEVEVQIGELKARRKVEHAPSDCGGQQTPPPLPLQLSIEEADYQKSKDRLFVKGTYRGDRPEKFELYDDITNELLSDTNVRKKAGYFKFLVAHPNPIPCRVRVVADNYSQVEEVRNAPGDCSGIKPPPGSNQPPVCSILKPNTNSVSIQLGDAVDFKGTASDPEGGPLTYEWETNGGTDSRPLVADPGPLFFDVKAGTFLVHFYVTDDKGARCDSTVTVIVGDGSGSGSGGTGGGSASMVRQQPAPGDPAAGDGKHTVLPFNDLGMHCGDLRSYPFSILPLFNTVNAHAIQKGTTGANRPKILDDSSVELRYSAASNPNDPVGPDSINSTSQNFPVGASADQAQISKTDFWDDLNGKGSVVSQLFPGLNPMPDEGLQTLDNPDHGRYMPGLLDPYVANEPQLFGMYLTNKGWFTAQGIPMTPVDDKGRFNSYPLMRVQMVEKGTDNVLATTDVVVPVSTEVDCRDCHTLGKVGADPAARQGVPGAPNFVAPASADRVDVEVAAKKNILALHDFKHGTSFLADDNPVLCASCHRSNALATVGGPQGVDGLDNMSRVMHGFHGRLQIDDNGKLMRDANGEPMLINPQNRAGTKPLIPFGPKVSMEQNCFLCHPGKITQCFRGAMFTAGRKCDDCHGDLLAVGGEFPMKNGLPREPWADEPKCGACHTGVGSDPVGTIAYDPNDPAATPLTPKTMRFAENNGTLYRESHDNHAGLGCESCHGSPHAIWPNRNPDANDNVTAMQLQGHRGTITECTTCHEPGSFPKGTLDGPHGMHPVNDPDWIKEHGEFYEHATGGDPCAACHGDDHRGTRLAKTPVDRVLKDRKGKVKATLNAGDIVSCDLCHSLAKSFDD